MKNTIFRLYLKNGMDKIDKSNGKQTAALQLVGTEEDIGTKEIKKAKGHFD